MTEPRDHIIEVRRDRVNKHSVRFTARDCTESAAAPCSSVSLPKELLATLNTSEPDALYVTIHTTDPAAETAVLREVSQMMRARLGVEDLSEVSPIYEDLLMELSSDSAARLRTGA